MKVENPKQWHRFWQGQRSDVKVVCIDETLLQNPLFGKVFDRYAFFERVIKNFDGILIVKGSEGYYLVSRKYIAYFPDKVMYDYEKTCKKDQVDIQLLFDTLVNRFIKEV